MLRTREKIMDAHRIFTDPLSVLGKKARREAEAVYPALVEELKNSSEHADSKLRPDDRNPLVEQFYLRDSEYIMPAITTSIMNLAANNPDHLSGMLRKVAVKASASPAGTLDLFARQFVNLQFLRFMKKRPYTQYAVSDAVWERVKNLGNVEKFPINQVVNKVNQAHLFYRENGDLGIIYPTLYAGGGKGLRKVARIELYKPTHCLGGAFLDLYDPGEPGVRTIGDLIKWYDASGRIILLGEEEDRTAHSRELARYVNLIWVLSCENVYVQKPAEINPVRKRLLDEGKKAQACKHRSYMFVEYDNIRYRYDKKRIASGEAVRSVRPHIRTEHIHGYWTGPRDGERTLVTRFIPTLLVKGGPDPSDNRVFKTLDKAVEGLE